MIAGHPESSQNAEGSLASARNDHYGAAAFPGGCTLDGLERAMWASGDVYDDPVIATDEAACDNDS